MTYRSNFTIQKAAILIMNSSVSSLIHMQIVKTIDKDKDKNIYSIHSIVITYMYSKIYILKT